MEKELRGSGTNIRYRQMIQRLVNAHQLVLGKEIVPTLLKIHDPEGIELRTKHTPKTNAGIRGQIICGKSWLRQIEAICLLHPWAIDGFNMCILWFDVGYTNKYSIVISQYFVDCMRQLGGTAKVISADCGTESCYVAVLQRFMRRDMSVKMIGREMTVSCIENQYLTNESKPGGVCWEKTKPKSG